MKDKTQSPWKRPLSGKRKRYAWLVLFVVAVLLIFGIALITDNGKSSKAELILASLVIGGVIALVVYALVRFVSWICCWRNFRRFAFGVACFMTLIALAYFVENMRGRSAWLKHKAAWEAKGERFSITKLAPRPVPDDQNFALTPLLKPAMDYAHNPTGLTWLDTNGLARLDRFRADTQPGRDTDYKLVTGHLDKGTFADLAAWQSFYRSNTNYPQPTRAGSPAEDVLFALGKFDAEFKELHEALRTRPLVRFPIEYEYEPPWAILLPHLARVRGITMVTHVRATALLEAGRSAEALEDLKLGLRLSEAISDEPLLIDHLVRIATLGFNLQTLREGLVRHAWTDAQLTEMEKQLARVDLLAEYKLAQRGERALSATGLEWLRRQGFRASTFNYLSSDEGAGAWETVSMLFPGGWLHQNMLAISQMHQEFTLAAADEKTRRVFPDVCDRLDSIVEKMRIRPYTMFAKLLMPALSKAVRRSARMQTSVDAARVAGALERHRLATGALPESLEVLTPRYLERIPTDLFDGKPLRYRRQADGAYLIYSIGWNQADDGGVLAWKGNKEKSVDLENGDWAWEMPAK